MNYVETAKKGIQIPIYFKNVFSVVLLEDFQHHKLGSPWFYYVFLDMNYVETAKKGIQITIYLKMLFQLFFGITMFFFLPNLVIVIISLQFNQLGFRNVGH